MNEKDKLYVERMIGLEIESHKRYSNAHSPIIWVFIAGLILFGIIGFLFITSHSMFHPQQLSVVDILQEAGYTHECVEHKCDFEELLYLEPPYFISDNCSLYYPDDHLIKQGNMYCTNYDWIPPEVIR